MSEKNIFRAKLMRWGDSSASGRTVTFKLPDDTDEHPFKGLPVGAKNGQLVEVSVTIIDTDGEPETLSTKKPHRYPQIGPRVPVVDSRDVDALKAPPPPGPRALFTNLAAPRRDQPTTAAVPEAAPVPAPAATAAPTAAAPVAKPAAAPTTRTAPIDPLPVTMPSTAPPAPPEPTPAPAAEVAVGPENRPSSGGAVIGGANLEAYADQMGQAAAALSSVAERMEQNADDDLGHYAASQGDGGDDDEPVGVKTVKRATELCKAVDKKRAGFFYYMRALYPDAPRAKDDGGEWSRDAQATGDRVCLHCETNGLNTLADSKDARRKFEELEREFERHERLR